MNIGQFKFDAALLIVDDIDDNRFALTRRLAREGYKNVTSAVDGEQALELLASRTFDLVLLDIMMPKLNGYEVLERMKADERYRHIPVVMISAIDEFDSVIRCIELGAEDYLPKPFNPILLRARVSAALERKRLHDEVTAQARDLAEWNRTLEQRVAEQVAEIERVGRLKRFLSPQVAEMILSGSDANVLESNRREIAVVFCDLRGFSAFSETAEPEEVMAVLGEYHAQLGPLIYQYDGTLERFTGDGIMVIFNAPLRVPDFSVRALHMALDMQRQVGKLVDKWNKYGHELGFGVGIAQGYATLGRIGFEGRSDYAAVGSVVNLASRLCAQARHGQILVNTRMQVAVEEFADVADEAELSLKGFQRGVKVFAVRGLKIHHDRERANTAS